jgi:hypothetical protein
MIRMSWTSWPRGVNERVVKILLDFIDKPLRELRVVVDEVVRSLGETAHRRFVAGSQRSRYIGLQGGRHAFEEEF